MSKDKAKTDDMARFRELRIECFCAVRRLVWYGPGQGDMYRNELHKAEDTLEAFVQRIVDERGAALGVAIAARVFCDAWCTPENDCDAAFEALCNALEASDE